MKLTVSKIGAFRTEGTRILHYNITLPGKLSKPSARRIIREAYPNTTFTMVSHCTEEYADEKLPELVQVAQIMTDGPAQ